MKKTLFKLLGCCLLAVMASCGGSDETTETTATTTTPNPSVEPPAEPLERNGTTIDCSACTHATLCGAGCDAVVLECHAITDSAFRSMRLNDDTGKHTYKVSTIRDIVNQASKCQDHRIIVDGDHQNQSGTNTDIVLKLVKLTAKDKARATPVSYAFPLFKNIILEHSPKELLFYKARKDDYDDILIQVIGSNGKALAHYDLSDIPPAVGTYEEVPITE